MSDLSIKILNLLHGAAPGEFVYLREREEFAGYPHDTVLGQAEELTEKGYLRIVKTEGFVEIDSSLVNYYFEITAAGRELLAQLQIKTG